MDALSGQRPMRVDRVLTRARLGEHVRATSEADELLQIRTDAGSLFTVSCVYAISSDKSTTQKNSEQYAVRAVALLKQAIGAGFSDFEHLRRNTDLKPLREREDFRELLDNLPDG